jgi:hypothetical protein
MNADEVKILREAMAERYPDAPDDLGVLRTWTEALADDDLGEMATSLASWYGRVPNHPPTVADLRNEPRVTVRPGSRIIQIARAAYEAECARRGTRPRPDMFRGVAETPAPEGDYTPGRVDEVGATGMGHVPFPSGGPPSSQIDKSAAGTQPGVESSRYAGSSPAPPPASSGGEA